MIRGKREGEKLYGGPRPSNRKAQPFGLLGWGPYESPQKKWLIKQRKKTFKGLVCLGRGGLKLPVIPSDPIPKPFRKPENDTRCTAVEQH